MFNLNKIHAMLYMGCVLSSPRLPRLSSVAWAVSLWLDGSSSLAVSQDILSRLSSKIQGFPVIHDTLLPWLLLLHHHTRYPKSNSEDAYGSSTLSSCRYWPCKLDAFLSTDRISKKTCQYQTFWLIQVGFISSGAMVYNSMIRLSCESHLSPVFKFEDPMVTPAFWLFWLSNLTYDTPVEAQVCLESLKI